MNQPKLTASQIRRNKLASPCVKVIPSYAYSPAPKPPSRVDRWRAYVKATRQPKK